MKLLQHFIKERRDVLILWALTVLTFWIIGTLTGYDTSWLAYAALLSLFFTAIILGVSFVRFRKRHQRLQELKDDPAPEDRLPRPAGQIESDYDGMVRELSGSVRRMKRETADKSREDADYYALWTHQIKTPIAAMRLLLDAQPDPVKLRAELFRIEEYAEMILQYQRLDSPDSDYRFESVSLEPLVRAAVRKYAPFFVTGKLSVSLEGLGVTVNTDEKWLSFIVEQLLSNALKYTNEGGISVTFNDGELRITDTGIGILPEDLPRVFEKGYTGWNGRMDKKASGLGLYLCRRAAYSLSLGLRLESVPELGTTAVLIFSDTPDVRD